MKINKIAILGLNLFLTSTLALFSQENQIELIIDTQKKNNIFHGIGAVSAGASSRLLIDYPEPYRSQILDYLFKPNYGAAFQYLKVEIGGDINSTDGSEPSHMRKKDEENYYRGYEWWLMKEAKKRNPDIMLGALAWGAPGWIGDGNYFSQDMADYIVKFLRGAKEHHNLNIEYVGLWNEKDFDVEWIKLYRKTLDESGFDDVNIIANDMNGPPEKMWEIADSMMVDKELKDAIYAIGVHYPHGKTPESALKLQSEGKKLWSTEDGEWNWYTMLPYRHMRANKINMNYIGRQLTKTAFWSPVTSYYSCLPAPGSGIIKANTPWSGNYQLEKTLWQIAHTTQFVQPGWYYLDDACFKLPSEGSVVSLADKKGDNISIIIETTQAFSEQNIIIKPQTNQSIDKLHVWYTNDLTNFAKGKDIIVQNDTFKFTAKPRSIYTLTTTMGQHRGNAIGPNPDAFPLPYSEKFNDYEDNATPRFLSDQNGAFEVVQNTKNNKILIQQIVEKGIDWSGGKSAFSIIGDEKWTNIEVSADVSFSGCDNNSSDQIFASLIARNYQGAVWAAFNTQNPIGYNFKLFINGRWELSTANGVLSSGEIKFDNKEWTNLKITCFNNTIELFINNKLVLEIEDTEYRKGMAGIGCSFEPVYFDNLQINQSKR